MSRFHRSLHVSLMAALTTTIVFFALGSASIPAILSFGQTARWVGLVLVCLLSFVIGGLVRPTAPPRLFLRLLALAAALDALALLSAAWSVAPRLTFERAMTLLLLFVATSSLAYAVSAGPPTWRWLLMAILAGAVIVCLLGLVVLAAAPGHAVEWPTPERARFQGIGQNPNTVPMLAALATPIAAWISVDARRALYRAIGVGALLLLLGTIAASNSRGALVAVVVSLVVLGLLSGRPLRGVLVALGFATAFVVAATVVWKAMPTASTAAPPPAVSGPGAKKQRQGPAAMGNQYFPGALYDEIGRPVGGGEPTRGLLESSGRVQAWAGAFRQGNERPALGFGFGTEERVFSDRYYTFQGSRPENSYLGMYLQLGAVGVALLLAMWLTLARAAYDVRRVSPVGAICASVVAGGLVLTLVQSYVYSVGNIATISFWICAFLLVVAVRAPTEDAA